MIAPAVWFGVRRLVAAFLWANESGDKSPHSTTGIDRGMMSSMKLPVLLLVVLLLICTSCKLEPLSATPNSNATPNQTPAAAGATDQEPKSNCSLTLAGAPQIHGLRLGMTP